MLKGSWQDWKYSHCLQPCRAATCQRRQDGPTVWLGIGQLHMFQTNSLYLAGDVVAIEIHCQGCFRSLEPIPPSSSGIIKVGCPEDSTTFSFVLRKELHLANLGRCSSQQYALSFAASYQGKFPGQGAPSQRSWCRRGVWLRPCSGFPLDQSGQILHCSLYGKGVVS